MREALGSDHIESRVAGGPSRSQLIRLSDPKLSAKVRDIDDADAILVIGTDPLHSSPILDLRIRKAMRRNGAKLAVATDRPTPLDGGAERSRPLRPGGAGAFLAGDRQNDRLAKRRRRRETFGGGRSRCREAPRAS